mmetsp:Transcript_24328/g.54167  ORF Transcript_24328/g.54167 Transcript_24328/m.54167 type:complete len:204 (-) Transcript_24328:1649-2260(-)
MLVEADGHGPQLIDLLAQVLLLRSWTKHEALLAGHLCQVIRQTKVDLLKHGSIRFRLCLRNPAFSWSTMWSFTWVDLAMAHELLHDLEPMSKLSLHGALLTQSFWQQGSPALVPLKDLLKVAPRCAKPRTQGRMPRRKQGSLKHACYALEGRHVNPEEEVRNWSNILTIWSDRHLCNCSLKPAQDLLHQRLPVRRTQYKSPWL